MTISGLPILIGLGIDFAIQIHNRVEEEVVLDHAEHPMSETQANLAPALIVATVSGVVAFLALQVSQVPMIRDFGVMLAIGIVVLVFVGIVIPTAVLGIREYRVPTGARGESLVERIVVKLGSLPPASAIPLVVASVALFIGGIALEGSFKIESDPLRWIDQSSQTVADVEIIDGQTRTLDVSLGAAQLGEVVVEYERPMIQSDAIGVPVIRGDDARTVGIARSASREMAAPAGGPYYLRQSPTPTNGWRNPPPTDREGYAAIDEVGF